VLARSLHHASFTVGDLAAARRFYGDILGLSEIARPDLGVPGAWYQCGHAQIHLIVAPAGVATGTPPPSLTPVALHTALAIEDYDDALARLKMHGLDVLETSPSVGQMWIQDPSGNVIELIAAPRS